MNSKDSPNGRSPVPGKAVKRSPMPRLTGEELQALGKLLRPAGREDAGLLLIPGYKCAEEYLRAGGKPKYALLDSDLDDLSEEALGKDLWRTLQQSGVLRHVREHELARLADQPHPEGLVLVGPPPGYVSRKPPQVVLDGVQDPGNVGAILRSALWFGLTRIWLLMPCADPFSPRCIRAGMGSVFHLKDCRLIDENEMIMLADSGVNLIGLDAKADISLEEHTFKSTDILVMGGESRGLFNSQFLLSSFLRIPGAGLAESLNVGHAFAVCAWQRRQALGHEAD